MLPLNERPVMVPLKSLDELNPGDIVRNKSGSEAYIVTANYGTRVTAVRTMDLTNPGEWLVLK